MAQAISDQASRLAGIPARAYLPKPMAKADATAMRRCAAEAARAALLTVHAAVGVTWKLDPVAARMLRAAEGLVRSSVAIILKPPQDETVDASMLVDQLEVKENAKKKKKKKQRKGKTAVRKEESVGLQAQGVAAGPPVGTSSGTSLGSLDPGARWMAVDAVGYVGAGCAQPTVQAEVAEPARASAGSVGGSSPWKGGDGRSSDPAVPASWEEAQMLIATKGNAEASRVFGELSALLGKGKGKNQGSGRRTRH